MNTPGLLSFLALALAAAPAFAQSMQVLSSGEEARRCSDAAQMASTIGGASRTDLEDCNRALVTVVLRQRDRAATLVNRGMAWKARGELVRAEQDYRDALLIAPEWALATSRLERVLAKRKAAATPEPVATPKA